MPLREATLRTARLDDEATRFLPAALRAAVFLLVCEEAAVCFAPEADLLARAACLLFALMDFDALRGCDFELFAIAIPGKKAMNAMKTATLRTQPLDIREVRTARPILPLLPRQPAGGAVISFFAAAGGHHWRASIATEGEGRNLFPKWLLPDQACGAGVPPAPQVGSGVSPLGSKAGRLRCSRHATRQSR